MKKFLWAFAFALAATAAHAQYPNWNAPVWVDTANQVAGLSTLTSVQFVNNASTLITIQDCAADPCVIVVDNAVVSSRKFWRGPRNGGADAEGGFGFIFPDDLFAGTTPADDSMVQIQSGAFAESAPGGTAELANIAGTESAGTSDKWARADHVHALSLGGTGFEGLSFNAGALGLDVRGLTEDTTPNATTFYTLQVGTTTNKKILMVNLVKEAINDATEDTNPDATADFVNSYKTSATDIRKVKVATLTQEAINDATEDTSPDASNDYVGTIDASASNVIKKVKIKNLRAQQFKSIVIGFPGAAENVGITNFPVAGTITSVCGVLVGSSSPSVTYNIKFGSDRSAAGTSVTTSPTALTSTTTCAAAAALNNTAVTAGDNMWFVTTAQSGTVTEIDVTIGYTIP